MLTNSTGLLIIVGTAWNFRSSVQPVDKSLATARRSISQNSALKFCKRSLMNLPAKVCPPGRRLRIPNGHAGGEDKHAATQKRKNCQTQKTNERKTVKTADMIADICIYQESTYCPLPEASCVIRFRRDLAQLDFQLRGVLGQLIPPVT